MFGGITLFKKSTLFEYIEMTEINGGWVYTTHDKFYVSRKLAKEKGYSKKYYQFTSIDDYLQVYMLFNGK